MVELHKLYFTHAHFFSAILFCVYGRGGIYLAPLKLYPLLSHEFVAILPKKVSIFSLEFPSASYGGHSFVFYFTCAYISCEFSEKRRRRMAYAFVHNVLAAAVGM